MNEEQQKHPRPDDLQRNREGTSDPLEGATVTPAIRHIGKTLESDPEYYAVVTLGYSTPEAQIAAEAGSLDVDQRQMEEDDFDPLSGRTLENRPEPLKTRLPGDTSSDPHTDVGPDNASNIQERQDAPKRVGANRR